MEKRDITTRITVCVYEELDEIHRRVVDAAKVASANAYAPYSRFQVGAALLLENGEIVSGNNQENSAYPSGLCAERVTMFYANAKYPDVAPQILAIAAYTNEAFLKEPITPCGACRQVLVESEVRYGKKIEVLLYGEDRIFKIESTKSLLPLAFEKESLGK